MSKAHKQYSTYMYMCVIIIQRRDADITDIHIHTYMYIYMYIYIYRRVPSEHPPYFHARMARKRGGGR